MLCPLSYAGRRPLAEVKPAQATACGWPRFLGPQGRRMAFRLLRWYPRRESNSHPQLRRLALCPLSYRGHLHVAVPLAGVEPATLRSRKPVRCPLRYKGIGRSEGVEPVDCGLTIHCVAVTPRPPWTGNPRARGPGGGLPAAEAEGLEPPAAYSRGDSLAPSCIAVLPRLQLHCVSGE